MRASSLIKVTGSLSSHSHHAYLFIWSNSWLVTHHSCICDMNGLQRSMSSHVMLPAHECETPPNHPTLTRSGLQKSHIAGGLSTVKGAGLVPHTYTQTRVPVRSKVSILRARVTYFNTHIHTHPCWRRFIRESGALLSCGAHLFLCHPANPL
ncbi:uncharacterized protein LOC107693954 isoform X2 [Sinocyclocheilus anshuiensis]|uniref:uncharacterized protein LOC107693954 isoform X2 n=1 Tax=Sinocyclocheilus anshuiensis TaxID=1608454 RepID=UPI0007B9214B|nr:PREDICTED: uncharacterized protein LOC107693954 isoform X2 [Sinocyclocheilus anshuiensis]